MVFVTVTNVVVFVDFFGWRGMTERHDMTERSF
jgi:hypothetical protein